MGQPTRLVSERISPLRPCPLHCNAEEQDQWNPSTNLPIQCSHGPLPDLVPNHSILAQLRVHQSTPELLVVITSTLMHSSQARPSLWDLGVDSDHLGSESKGLVVVPTDECHGRVVG